MADESAIWVEAALRQFNGSHAALAAKLGVSEDKIEQWLGPDILSDLEERQFRELTSAGDLPVEAMLVAGTSQNAEKWRKLIFELVKSADDTSDTGFDISLLTEDAYEGPFLVFSALATLGVSFPDEFPVTLDYDYDEQLAKEQDENGRDPIDRFFDAVAGNPYTNLIATMLDTYAKLVGFCAAFIEPIMDETDDAVEDVSRLQDDLLVLAALRSELDFSLATNIEIVLDGWPDDIKRCINRLKQIAADNDYVLQTDIMRLMTDNPDDLADEASEAAFHL